ncbi:MAG: LamG-like jellyroll fold domain-containing protein [Ilumatobacteraceae bacterium]
MFTGTYTMQGLIVQQTFRSFIGPTHRRNQQRRMFVGGFVNGKATPLGDFQIPVTGDFYMRLKREGNTFTVSWSDDKIVWHVGVVFDRPMVVTGVGVFTGSHNDNGPSVGVLGSIDYFFNTASPIVPEDGTTAANVGPTVDAGASASVRMPAALQLSPSASDDGLPSVPGTLTASWSMLSGPGTVTFSNASALNPTASFSAAGTYVLGVTVNDGAVTDSDTIEVEVLPAIGAPIVDAGENARATTEQVLTLTGTASDDGLPNPLTYSWSVVSGPGTANFTAPSQAITGVSFATPGTYLLRFAASDGANESADLVQVDAVLPRVTTDLVALYDFTDTDGDIIHDLSLSGNPLDLYIANTTKISWNRDSLTINAPTEIASHEPATKISDAVKASNAVTIEAWVRPSTLTQSGPARIVSISDSSSTRNLTIGQGESTAETGRRIETRIRTTDQSLNGTPSVVTANTLTSDMQHLVYTRSSNGNVAIYRNGVLVQTGVASGTLANWDSNFALTLANEYGGGRAWIGEYELVAIYARALTPGQVSDHFQHGPGSSAGTRLRWPMPAPTRSSTCRCRSR